MDQGSLLLPRNYYINEADYTDQIEAYKTLAATVAGLLKEAGVTEEAISTDVDNMFEFEKAIAAITVDAPDRRNETEMYNPTTLAELTTSYPVRARKKKYKEYPDIHKNAPSQNLDWTAYIDAVFAGLSTEASVAEDDRIIAVEPEYFSALNDLLGGGTFDARTKGNELVS